MDMASSSQTKYTSFVAGWAAGALFAITGGGPIEGPPVFGPEAYEWEFTIEPSTTIITSNKLAFLQ